MTRRARHRVRGEGATQLTELDEELRGLGVIAALGLEHPGEEVEGGALQGIEGDDARALPRAHEALGIQGGERAPEGGSTDPELFSQTALRGQGLARRPATLQEIAAQPICCERACCGLHRLVLPILRRHRLDVKEGSEPLRGAAEEINKSRNAFEWWLERVHRKDQPLFVSQSENSHARTNRKR